MSDDAGEKWYRTLMEHQKLHLDIEAHSALAGSALKLHRSQGALLKMHFDLCPPHIQNRWRVEVREMLSALEDGKVP